MGRRSPRSEASCPGEALFTASGDVHRDCHLLGPQISRMNRKTPLFMKWNRKN